MTDSHVNLAARRLGAGVIAASDEFFGEQENLLRPEPPAHRPHSTGFPPITPPRCWPASAG